MKTCWMVVATMVAVLSGAPARGQQPSLTEMEEAIDRGCRQIMSTQNEEGALVLDTGRFGITSNRYVFKVGTSALGTLALQHALPHLRGKTATDARQAVHKSLEWLAKQPPEQNTYSAGMAICVLYQADPRRYQQLIGEYAAMLVLTQRKEGPDTGIWAYRLYPAPGREPAPGEMKQGDYLGEKCDHSNTQIAVLGLLYAQMAGYQAPRKTWEMLRQHYIDKQVSDGGWAYRPQEDNTTSTANMTLVNTISLQICDEILSAGDHKECKPLPENPAVTRGLEYIATNVDCESLETYGLYAAERLGILSGLSDFGGKPWFDAGARRLLTGPWNSTNATSPNQQIGAAFAVLFLSRGLEPVIINKLKRGGTDDWNNDRYDVKRLVEYVSTRFQIPKQWRIVTLEADVEFLKRVPILFISGHDPLTFSPEEKSKLKAYVEAGGTIFGMACCESDKFRRSFLDLVKELWPEGELVNLPRTHPIYTQPRPASERPRLQGMTMGGEEGRLGVIFSPGDLCCRWHVGGSKAKGAYEVGANLTFYVERMHSASPSVEKPEPEPEPVTPEPAILGP